MQDSQITPTVEGASSVQRMVRRVYFTMVKVPGKGWTRVGKAYASKETARGWLGFVSEAWHGLRTKVSQCTLKWQGGEMTPRSRETLSTKYNMEPSAPNNAMSHERSELAP
jgi:hypothetical protein